MKTIHTFGDSHSMFGWKDVKNATIKINHIGPKLMHTFGKEKDALINLSNYSLGNGDKIIYCFGEIDCRCQIHKFVSIDSSYEKIIDKLVDSYIEAIKNNMKYYNIEEVTTCVYCIVPPVKNVGKNNNQLYPFLGSDEERKKYHLYMNKKLKEYCDKNKIVFFDITNQYEDENNFLKLELSDMICHIKDPLGLEKTIEKLGFI